MLRIQVSSLKVWQMCSKPYSVEPTKLDHRLEMKESAENQSFESESAIGVLEADFTGILRTG